MSHDQETSLKLVRMANQIGIFFDTQSGPNRAASVADHINKFWEPRMRRQFLHLYDTGAEGFSPIVREAAASVRRPDPVDPPSPSA